MTVFNISDMKNGWFIGNFEPSIFKNCFFEIAHHVHPAGYITPRHFHKIAQELTYIIKGKLIVENKVLQAGQMFLYEPNEIANVKVIEDADLIVVKWPSIPQDKYMEEKK
jgi:quercetin dioxygenase-like cupin family protein